MRMRSVLIALFFMATPATADSLGYLFTSPTQRATLDALRLNASGVVIDESEMSTSDTRRVAAKPVKVDGVVSSSSGKTSAWINGAKAPTGTKSKTGKVDVILNSEGKTITLKPGQSFEPDSGKIHDTLHGGVTNAPSKCSSTKTTDGDFQIVCDGP